MNNDANQSETTDNQAVSTKKAWIAPMLEVVDFASANNGPGIIISDFASNGS